MGLKQEQGDFFVFIDGCCWVVESWSYNWDRVSGRATGIILGVFFSHFSDCKLLEYISRIFSDMTDVTCD